MKVILSRKGFDSSVGGCASPILPDGRLVSLPIPTSKDTKPYADLFSPCGRTYLQLITELGGQGGIAGRGAHVDPCLEKSLSTAPDSKDWRPSLGQISAAAGHLRNENVGPGDLFLFYGWFRQTIELGGKLRYTRDPGMHLIFGYLEIAEVLPFSSNDPIPSWLNDHPHTHPDRRATSTNTIYVGTECLSNSTSRSGGGTLGFHESRILTAPGLSRGKWKLDPALFRNAKITYHTTDAWKSEGYFQSYPRAQEYVIHADRAIEQWARGLIEM